MIRYSALWTLMVVIQTCSWASNDSTTQIYSVDYKWELPLTLGGFGLIKLGYNKLQSHSQLSESIVLNLSKNDVNSFDRGAFDFDSKGYDKAQHTSDVWVNALVSAPALLLLDKRIRSDWASFLTLYLESHLAGSSLYMAAAFSNTRPRPLAYNMDVPLSVRSGSNTGNSFFSGHTSTAATSSFFMAQVLSDYNDFSTGKRLVAYSIAAIPPIIVGYNRIKAGKHFRTDVITGFSIGALTGILIPSLHRLKFDGIALVPTYNQGVKGLSMSYFF